MNLKGNLTSKGLQGSIGKSRMQGILGTNPAAIPITVDNALSLSSTNPVQNKVITAAITNRLWSDEVKTALLQIVEKVAFIDEHGQDYYDAMYDALYPPVGLDSISAVFDSSATIYNTDTLDDLKQYLTVTAYYTSGDSEVVTTYTLSGSMDAGTQTITVSYGGKTTTFTVTVVEWLVSIDAVFTQGSATIYDTDSLDTLKQYLVVTATYADSTTAVVTDYTLSGTLAAGTSTITVSYGGKTDTFSVTVTHLIAGWYYPFNGSILSSGTEDFGLSGVEEYATGHDGTRLCYYHHVATIGDSSTDPLGLKALNVERMPDLGNDFTISFWCASDTNQGFRSISMNKYYSTSTPSASNYYYSSVTATDSTWTVAQQGSALSLAGLSIFATASGGIFIPTQNQACNKSSRINIAWKSGFDTTEWHHYALTRKDNTIRFFIDGVVIVTATTTQTTVRNAGQVAICNIFNNTSSGSGNLAPVGWGEKIQDLYIAEFCKWETAFEPSNITY